MFPSKTSFPNSTIGGNNFAKMVFHKSFHAREIPSSSSMYENNYHPTFQYFEH
jgi:hypothetical protein